MKKILIVLLVTFNQLAPAQCPTADFNLSLISCLQENIEFINNSANYDSLYWDFCSADLMSSPESSTLAINFINEGWGAKIVFDNSNWYSFIASRNNNFIIRLDYGTSLDNQPTIVNLGNIDSKLSSPEGIDIINNNGNWFGFVPSLTSNHGIVKLEFGNSLTNIPTATNIGNFGYSGRIREVKVVEQNGDYILINLLYESKKIARINFRDSFSNTINPSDIYESAAITDAINSVGIQLVNYCGNWKAIESSVTSEKIIQLDFGNNLLSEPTVEASYTFSEVVNPRKINIINENGEYYVLIANATGNMSMVNFHDFDPINFPTVLDNSEFNQFIAIAVAIGNGKKYIHGVNGSNSLYTYVFNENCGQSYGFSNEYEPYGLFYTSPGTYNIELTAINSMSGYTTTIAKQITISPSTAPILSTQITGNCLTTPISFAGEQLSGNITSWNWDFGDGSGTSTLQNDTYSYATAGEYQVKLSVTDANGCNNLYIDTARVYEEPIPDFTAPLGTLCMNNPIAFTNTTTGETGPVVSWTWDFNGEGTSTEKEPDFTFLTSGSKTITLTSSLPGCANVTQQNITIEEAPTTAFSFDDNTCNGQTTVFTDATTGNNLIAWSWDFGDGSNSTDQSPTYNYTLPGKYVVTLAVSNNLGCTTTKVDTVYNGAIPVVSFINDLPCSTSPIQFTDQSTVQDANLVAWEWDFGDSNSSTNQNPQYTYNQTGDFTVQLKTFSQFGCVDSTESIITILQGPEVDFIWDKGCEGEATIFTDSTNSFGQPITNWTWLIDDNLFTEQNPQYIFQEEDSFTVQLGVFIDNLCSQTISKNIFVETPATTSFDYFESCTEDSTTFVDTTPAAIESWQWRIDGTPAGSESIMTINLVPGNYSISLTTTSANRCITNITESIDIVGSLSAQYSVSTNYGAAPLTIEFSNQSTGTNGYLWLFGDSSNSSSIEFDPVFVFTELGCYPVTLIALGGLNCSDTTIQVMEVVEPINELTIDAISSLDDGKIAISMDNSGSITYDENNLQLIFNIDDGVDIIEAFTMILYPKTVINYVPSIILGETGNSKILCVELKFIVGPSEVLDSNCINLIAEPVIISAYPNPSGDEINLSVVLPQAGEVNIMMIDRNGAILLSTVEDGEQGLNNYRIDTTPYRSGLYIIKIEAGDKVQEMKVVIDR